MMENTVIQYDYEMSLDHREFLRTFSQVFPQGGYLYQNNQLMIERGIQRIVVSLAPSSERKIALLSLPVTQVKFEFFYTEPEIADEWMQQIMRYFQRGGG
ncbi:MAG: hypothetical protein RIS84_879 [Pseudomonadota bacterium]|jgi:hypothetical protein